MLRPCLVCGYRSEPREGGACPECGTASPPPSWVIVEVTLPAAVRRLFLGLALLGIGFPLLLITIPLFFGASTLSPACLLLFPILFVPFLLRHLFSRHALGIIVIRDDGIATSTRGLDRICSASDGWRASELQRDPSDPHRWVIEVGRPSRGGGDRLGERIEIPIDARIDDPQIVARAVHRALQSNVPP